MVDLVDLDFCGQINGFVATFLHAGPEIRMIAMAARPGAVERAYIVESWWLPSG